MVVGTEFGSAGDAGEVPAVELSRETGVFGLAKVFGEDRVGKFLAIDNNERTSVW